MSLSNENLRNILDIDPNIVRELESKCKSKLGELNKTSRIIKDEIFNILSTNSIFIQYPIEDDELCGFVCKKKGKIFSFVNSYIPFEKQIFAAAHELYHIWYDEENLLHGELIKDKMLETNFEDERLNLSEVKANRFAAILLIPKDVLFNELDYMGLDKKYFESTKDAKLLTKIIRLIQTFGVPYKTMVRRLYEVGIIEQDRCLELLNIPDRDEEKGVRLVQKRMQVGEELQQRTRIIKFNGLIDSTLSAFESNLISEEKLKYLLAIARKTPEELGVNIKDKYDEKELLDFLENDKE